MCVCVVKYYTAMKMNEIMPLAATWMQLQSIILRKTISYGIICMWNLIYDIDEPFDEMEIDSQTESRLVVATGEGIGGGRLGLADVSYYITYEMDKQKSPSV